MSRQVLVVHSVSQTMPQLVKLFEERQDQVWQVTSPAEARSLMKERKPELLVMDLLLLDDGWEKALPSLRRR